jgi:hypothetical protein
MQVITPPPYNKDARPAHRENPPSYVQHSMLKTQRREKIRETEIRLTIESKVFPLGYSTDIRCGMFCISSRFLWCHATRLLAGIGDHRVLVV